VAAVDASGERLETRAINSCIQFLPTLDGKELLTVESLAVDEQLHPVQQALVDCHGSQCGFCTPGFVMSLFALYKNKSDPTRTEIDDALAGNLCRCTGYRPIVSAASEMYRLAPGDGDWIGLPAGKPPGEDESARVALLQSLAVARPLCIEWHNRRFFSPQSTDQLAQIFAASPDATLLAGGTDVGLWVTKQYRDLDTVVYVGNVASLQNVTVTDTHIEIGAAVSLTDAMPVILEHYPALGELFARFASPPIRNAATLGGNVANGSPIGDSMPALLVLCASLVLRCGEEQRLISLDDFYVAYQQTALRPGEFIERIRIPLPGGDDEVRSYKVSKRFDQDISAVCAAFRLRLDGGSVADFRAAFGGMAETPKRALRCEQMLLGKEWCEDSVAAAATMLDEDFAPISDLRASSAYRRKICKNLLTRFLLETTGTASMSVYSYGR
jgi:xanthine dehydrogenase small subunit